jgi:hypothetical protein
VFTKLLRSVAALFRSLFIALIIYLDDMLLFHKDPQVLVAQVRFVIRVLKVLGFQVNGKKAILLPTQRILFLGFEIDSVTMRVSIPPTKLSAFQRLVDTFCKNKPVL